LERWLFKSYNKFYSNESYSGYTTESSPGNKTYLFYANGTYCNISVYVSVDFKVKDCSDSDHDGYGYGNDCSSDGDCDDSDASVYQYLNGYVDSDGDGYGAGSVVQQVCSGSSLPSGYVTQGGDCDDSSSSINPGASEVCGDGIDNDCDGSVDEGCSSGDSGGSSGGGGGGGYKTDACNAGETRKYCSMNNVMLKECGDFDGDGYTEWKSSIWEECNSPAVCIDGNGEANCAVMGALCYNKAICSAYSCGYYNNRVDVLRKCVLKESVYNYWKKKNLTKLFYDPGLKPVLDRIRALDRYKLLCWDKIDVYTVYPDGRIENETVDLTDNSLKMKLKRNYGIVSDLEKYFFGNYKCFLDIKKYPIEDKLYVGKGDEILLSVVADGFDVVWKKDGVIVGDGYNLSVKVFNNVSVVAEIYKDDVLYDIKYWFIDVVDSDCEPDWICSWSECENGLSYPIDCYDGNFCGIDSEKPAPKQCSCYSNWSCSEWSDCRPEYDIEDVLIDNVFVDSYVTRTCVDLNNCSPMKTEKLRCSPKEYIKLEPVVDGNVVVHRTKDPISGNVVSEARYDRESGRLDINFLGDEEFPAHCYDFMKNYDEVGIDC